MKAFLLAAGKGTRLRPLTDTTPKCLLPIGDQPLLGHWIDLLARHGIDHMLINTHHHAEQVHAFVADRQRHAKVRLTTVFEPQLLGSGGTVWANRDFVAGQDAFVIAYADNLTDLNLTKMIDFHRHIGSMKGALTMGLIHAPDPTQCGIVTLDASRRVIDFEEKPRQPASDLANGGIYIAGSDVIKACGAAVESACGAVVDFGYHVLPRLVGRMFGYTIDSQLIDIGTPDSYAAACRIGRRNLMGQDGKQDEH